MDVRREVKRRLADAGVSLVSVARRSGLDYARVQRVLGGYAKPREREVETILSAITDAGRGR